MPRKPKTPCKHPSCPNLTHGNYCDHHTKLYANERGSTAYGELVYFIIHPTNISVLSDENVGARIYALMTVLKGIAEIEMLCLNSKENFEDNKQYLQRRIEMEQNPVIRKLLQ